MPVLYQLGSQIESRFFIPFTVISGKVKNKIIERKKEREREEGGLREKDRQNKR